MDIKEFFHQSAGRWFAHRTSHHLVHKQSEGNKAKLLIEILPQTDAAIAALCQQYNLEPSQALLGVQISWEPISDGLAAPRRNFLGTPAAAEPQKELTLLVPIAMPDQPSTGKLLRSSGPAGKHSSVGRYILGSDEALTLVLEDDDLYAEERIWFVSPNLRLRTSLLKRSDGFNLASFCSEIRLVETPQPEPASQAQASQS